MTRSSTRLGALALLFLGSACSGSGDDDDGPVSTAPVIDVFSVDRTLVQSGDTVTLTWKVSNATGVTINESGKDPLTTPKTDASQAFTIQLDTMFELVATNDMGEMASKSLMVTVDGIRIESFQASKTMATRKEIVTLSWNIVGEDPASVSIVNDEGISAYSGTDAQGTVDIEALATGDDMNVTYTLTTQGTTGTKMASLTITVVSTLPTITSFEARPSNIIEIGDNAQLFWVVAADQVQILEDGLAVRPWTSAGVPAGNVQRPVNTASVVFTLQARNEDDPDTVVDQTITVMGLPTPQFVNFSVTPLQYTEASTVATVVWEVTDADTLQLRVGNTVVPGFPTTELSGSFSFSVSGEPTVRLNATNAVTTNSMTQAITFGFNEREPNDRLNAIPIDADGVPVRGTISDAADLDWYVFMVPQGSLMFARAGFVRVMGVDVCSLDTIVRVYDAQGVQIGVNDNGPTGVSPCSQISPLVDSWAENMDAGTYYISVGVSGGGTPMGPYSLEVGVQQPPVGLTVTPTPVGAPAWNVGGFVMWTEAIGTDGGDIANLLTAMFSPFHAFAGFFALTAATSPTVAHPRDDYSNLLPLFTAIGGKTLSTTFTAADMQIPNGIYVGYTLYPTATSTGASFDRPSGPIIPNGLFPINVSLDIMKDGAMYSSAGVFDLPAYSQYATAGLPAVANAGDGDSHRHIISIVADIVATTPGGNVVGAYQWVYQLRDTTGAGYNITIPFTVQ